MKLREKICCEIINCILYYWDIETNLQMKINEFFLKKFLKKGKLSVFWKGNKMKVGYKDALLLDREKHNAKNYNTT